METGISELVTDGEDSAALKSQAIAINAVLKRVRTFSQHSARSEVKLLGHEICRMIVSKGC
jgi:hypothetical protein